MCLPGFRSLRSTYFHLVSGSAVCCINLWDSLISATRFSLAMPCHATTGQENSLAIVLACKARSTRVVEEGQVHLPRNHLTSFSRKAPAKGGEGFSIKNGYQLQVFNHQLSNHQHHHQHHHNRYTYIYILLILFEALSFWAGTSQGRTFAVHTFTALMVFLQQTLCETCVFFRVPCLVTFQVPVLPDV